MEEIIENPVNAGQEGVVDPQGEEQTEEFTGAKEPEVAEPVNQSRSLNAKFAAIRRQAEQEARDNLIRELSNGQFNTYQEYMDALEQQRMIEEGKDPELEALKQELTQFKREKTLAEQAQALANKPFYQEWEADIKNLADTYQIDYRTAYTFLLEENVDKIFSQLQQERQQLEADRAKIEEEAIKNYLAKKRTPIGVTEGEGATPVTQVSQPKTFEEARQGALAILKAMQKGGS